LATVTTIVFVGSFCCSDSVAPGIPDVSVLLALWIATPLTVTDALVACVALSAAVSPEMPLASVSVNPTPLPPVHRRRAGRLEVHPSRRAQIQRQNEGSQKHNPSHHGRFPVRPLIQDLIGPCGYPFHSQSFPTPDQIPARLFRRWLKPA